MEEKDPREAHPGEQLLAALLMGVLAPLIAISGFMLLIVHLIAYALEQVDPLDQSEDDPPS